jgi:hypothetical protein
MSSIGGRGIASRGNGNPAQRRMIPKDGEVKPVQARVSDKPRERGSGSSQPKSSGPDLNPGICGGWERLVPVLHGLQTARSSPALTIHGCQMVRLRDHLALLGQPGRGAI